MFPLSYFKSLIGREIVVVLQITPTLNGEWSGKVLDVTEAPSSGLPTGFLKLEVPMQNEKTKEKYTTTMHIPLGVGMVRLIRGAQSSMTTLVR
jgi:hypothetical protein